MTTVGPTSDELVAVAAGDGHSVSASTLSHWRRRGLLPRLRRVGGGRSVYVHPVGADRQLRRLLYWRTRSTRLYVCAIELWIEGFPIRPGVVRGALLEFVADWGRNSAKILGPESDPVVALESLSAETARKRSQAPVPHLSRMRLEDREKAYAYVFAVMLGLDEEAEARSSDVPHVQRLFGMRRGHDGGLAADFDVDLQSVGSRLLGSPARLAVRDSSTIELEYVRRVVSMLTEWGPRLLLAELARKPVKGLDLEALVHGWLADPPPGVHALLVVDALSRLRERQPGEGELVEATEALAPEAVAREFKSMLADIERAGAPPPST